jgi:ATP-dependent protease ClpP protease subunit
LHEGSIKKEQHVEFLKEVRAHLKCKLLIIWAALKAHRSKLVREYLDSTGGDVPMGLAQTACTGQLFPKRSQ